MSSWNLYERKQKPSIMRPYEEGEGLEGVSVSPEDTPGTGGFIAMNRENPADKWYVSASYFAQNFNPDPVGVWSPA